MSLQALRSPVLPSSVLSWSLFTKGSNEGEANTLASSSSSASPPARYPTAFVESAGECSRALSDTQTSNSEGGEHGSAAECTLPYLLLSEALAGLPATFNTTASDKASFYSYSDAVSQQRESASCVADKNGNVIDVSVKEASVDTGRPDLIVPPSCTQEAQTQASVASLPPSYSENVSSLRPCCPGNHAHKAFLPFEEALVTVHNCFNSETHETAAENCLASCGEKAPQNDVDVKIPGAQFFKNLATVSAESVARGQGESDVENALRSGLAPRLLHAQATDLCDPPKDINGATGKDGLPTYVPKPEDLERIAYVIRGFGLPPGSSLGPGPSSGLHRSRDTEVLSGHDLAQFIGRRHTLPAKGPLEITRPNEGDLPPDRVVHRRHSGPFLLPVFSFCDSESVEPFSERVTATHSVASRQQEESPLSKSSAQSGQPREGSGDVEVLRRNSRAGGNTEQAKYTLIVNVPPTTTRQDLHLTFSAFGVVELTVVVCDKDHRHPNKEWTATSGYAFVRFSKTEEAAAAVAAAALGTVRLRGSRVRATWAKKDSVPKHACQGNTAAGCSRSTNGNGKGRSRTSEPGTPAQVPCLYQRVEDRETTEKQQRLDILASALGRDINSTTSEIPVHAYGFKVPLTLCSTPESAQEFACHICKTFLAADPVVLPCWHLFCNECLQQWKRHVTGGKENEYCCPNCGMWTTTAHEKKMDEGGPLLKLRQIRDAENVACFYTPRCRWTGPLSCITTHMRLHTSFRNPA